MIRDVSYQLLMEKLRREHLGIESGCLEQLIDLIDRVDARVRTQPDVAQATIQATTGFNQLLSRMIQEARRLNSQNLFEGTLAAARARCGILFWCDV
jgi:hypothetical protein